MAEQTASPGLTLDGNRVILFSPLDHRHRLTDACTHRIPHGNQASFRNLAICQDEGDSSYFLFYCDENWKVMADTWHLTLADAKEQAEFEFSGVSETWRSP